MISRVLGPVTYLVDTVDSLKWKRHADQIKTVLKPVVEPDLTEEKVTDTTPDTPSTDSGPRDETLAEDPPIGDSDNPPDDVVPRSQYPERVGRQPDRYGH